MCKASWEERNQGALRASLGWQTCSRVSGWMMVLASCQSVNCQGPRLTSWIVH